MTTEQEVLDDLIQAIDDTNRSNDDFLKVLKEGRDQDVALRDGTVVPSLTKRVVNAFSNSDYLMKADNLASVVDKQEARDNLNVPTKEDVLTATAQATDTVKGTAKIATTAIAQAGTNDTDIITALKLKQSFTSQHSNTGWEKLPDGLIIQWGLAAVGATTPFPIAFPTACYQVAVSYSSPSGNGMTFANQSITATRTGVSMYNVGGVPNSYIAIGK